MFEFVIFTFRAVAVITAGISNLRTHITLLTKVTRILAKLFFSAKVLRNPQLCSTEKLNALGSDATSETG